MDSNRDAKEGGFCVNVAVEGYLLFAALNVECTDRRVVRNLKKIAKYSW